MESYDVVIVGARPAGAAAAAFLARAGFRVLLTDRVRFPKPTLSCPLYFANTLDLLNRLGASEVAEQFHAPRLRWYIVQMEDMTLRGRMLPYNGIDYAYSIRRELFDTALFKHVAALPNIETRLGFTVTGLLWQGERVVGVRGHSEGGHPVQLRADMVVGADGIFSTVAEQVNAQKYDVIPPRTCVYYAYYSNVAAEDSEPTATLYYDTNAHFVFITSNSDSDLTVVSLTLPAAEFERARRDRETLHLECARRIPRMAERMRNAVRETPMYGVSPRESFYRTPFGPGWALVGDAGYYKDPLPGQGIHDALRSAELLSQAYIEYRRSAGAPGAWDNAFAKYQSTRDAETRPMYRLTDYYAQVERPRAPHERQLFRAITAMPDWSDRYVSMFNGVTDVKWFTSFPTPLRIVAEWRWRQLRARLQAPGPGQPPRLRPVADTFAPSQKHRDDGNFSNLDSRERDTLSRRAD